MLFLFDVDGTLTPARNPMKTDMFDFIQSLKTVPDLKLGIVGGSDFKKISEQIGEHIFELFDYIFAENGMVYYKSNKLIHANSLKTIISQSDLNAFISECLKYIADLDIPIKTGTFVEFRNGMLNVSPIGRNCSQTERDEFESYDKIHNIRQQMIRHLQMKFSQINFDYSIGGQISFDVFPKNFNKTLCLKYLVGENVDQIHFFGDKTDLGGNDYEIFNDPRVIGHKVSTYSDTIRICKQILKPYIPVIMCGGDLDLDYIQNQEKISLNNL
jgi:phosphomannomutase